MVVVMFEFLRNKEVEVNPDFQIEIRSQISGSIDSIFQDLIKILIPHATRRPMFEQNSAVPLRLSINQDLLNFQTLRAMQKAAISVSMTQPGSKKTVFQVTSHLLHARVSS